MVKQSFSSSHGDDDLSRWVKETIAEAKEGFKQAVRQWDREVNLNIPVGPPHKQKELEGSVYYEGLLRDSKTLSFTETDDSIEATISIGQTEGFPQVNYVRYVNARNGVDLLRGHDEAAESIDEALRHGRADDL